MQTTTPPSEQDFRNIPEKIYLGYQGKTGTVFELCGIHHEVNDKPRLLALLGFVMNLPQVRVLSEELKSKGGVLRCHYARPGCGHPFVTGFYFRDGNEFADDLIS